MKLGIMGGTFDPIHKGHLYMAKTALKEAGLDQVLLLPDGDPPHKSPVAAPEIRLHMVRLAIQNEEGLLASDLEIKRKGTTYTVDTLLALRDQGEKRELYYIVGSDTLFQIPTWHTAQKVAQMCSLLVMMRGDDQESEVRILKEKLFKDLGFKSRLLHARGLPISSGMIRERLLKGESVQDLLPHDVWRYIAENGLYRR